MQRHCILTRLVLILNWRISIQYLKRDGGNLNRAHPAIDIGGIDRRLGPRGVTFLKSKMAAQAGKKLK